MVMTFNCCEAHAEDMSREEGVARVVRLCIAVVVFTECPIFSRIIKAVQSIVHRLQVALRDRIVNLVRLEGPDL